ncbi:hypothetical protein BABINDRAFT_171534 [Babjeviella inositovora NRRL Y-12698]|uniref:SURF1-like protein n=1 Tax=Babjeviella inositovora NRRL Y-12698 TaxID=984486 RepID=A0A1E3QSU5_9ASCO|nr:uncharacterized protein BABINDRAFT_171534 [Babjeviella inositovora NRRL Y-12698]ODQ79987.1 hypothetical protein BABINDRAFT_171534 [Babjeviella inositovora NRRL Y-12698]
MILFHLKSALSFLTLFSRYSVPVRCYLPYKTSTIDWEPVKQKSGNDTTSKRVFLSLLVLMPVVSFFLGCWQVRRLQWKTKLIADSEERLAARPLQLPEEVDPQACNEYEYRKVLVNGKFDYDGEIFVGPRVRDGVKGYLLVCPLVRPNGDRILVERGWISSDMVIPERRGMTYLSRPTNEITIPCLLRNPPPKTSLQHNHEYGSRLFNFIDITVMTKQSKCLPMYLQANYDMRDHPEYIHEEPSQSPAVKVKKHWWSKNDKPEETGIQKIITEGPNKGLIGVDEFDASLEFSEQQFINAGVPIAKPAKVEFKNNHLNYLVTWYGLSILSTIALFSVLKKYNKKVDAKLFMDECF